MKPKFTKKTFEEGREELRNRWQNADGNVLCPNCGSRAQDWRLVIDILQMYCEDCREKEQIYINPPSSW